MRLARTVRFDDSDTRVFPRPAEPGEWAIPGGFEFSNWTEADLQGQARQVFAHGWLGLGSFGRATFVAVAAVEPAEIDVATQTLADHFRNVWGAPSDEVARAAARDEMTFMQELCADHAPNTLLAVTRELTDAGVRESFRAIRPDDAQLELVAMHASPD